MIAVFAQIYNRSLVQCLDIPFRPYRPRRLDTDGRFVGVRLWRVVLDIEPLRIVLSRGQPFPP